MKSFFTTRKFNSDWVLKNQALTKIYLQSSLGFDN